MALITYIKPEQLSPKKVSTAIIVNRLLVRICGADTDHLNVIVLPEDWWGKVK